MKKAKKIFKDNRKYFKPALDGFAVPVTFTVGKGNTDDESLRVEKNYSSYFGAFWFVLLFVLCLTYFSVLMTKMYSQEDDIFWTH